YAAHFREIPPQAPIIKHFTESFGFKEFAGRLGEDFGFERALKYLGAADGFLEYTIPTPLCRKPTGNPCRECNGTGRSEEFDRDCLFCEGDQDIRYDYQEAYAVSATLSLLLGLMEFPDIETTAAIPQLLTVTTATIRESHGGSLGGMYSRELVAYLKSRGPGPIPEMVAAMRTVWERVESRIRDFYDHYFSAYTQGQDGWLNVSCPGDRAGLNPAHSWIDKRRGCEFSCHNVDNPMQQLALLASLAALHDLARLAASK
ncbi:MAG: hypothetical protein AAB686_01745, partial [Patescibacteria group bacterium]